MRVLSFSGLYLIGLRAKSRVSLRRVKGKGSFLVVNFVNA